MLILANLPVFQRFTISHNNKIVHQRTLERTKSFYISFLHSVNKVPVDEFYKIGSNEFIVYKTVFYSYGAGMPEYNENYDVSVDNGKITVSNMNIRLPYFSVFVGTIAEHQIFFNDESFYLTKLAKPQSTLKFEIKRVSFVDIAVCFYIENQEM